MTDKEHAVVVRQAVRDLGAAVEAAEKAGITVQLHRGSGNVCVPNYVTLTHAL